MDHNQEALPLQILETPSPLQIQGVAEWLASHPDQNPDLELALHYILQNQLVPHQQGGLVAVAHTAASAGEFTRSDIQGVVVAKPGNASVSLLCTTPCVSFQP